MRWSVKTRAGSAGRVAVCARARLTVAVCTGVACLAACSIATASAVAAEGTETHVFNATLSLTGNCEVSKNDPVADPGCPEEPPHGALAEPLGVATDAYGDIYYFGRPAQGASAVIYIFDSSGRFLTEIPSYPAVENLSDGSDLGVDADGNLYLTSEAELFVLKPSSYDPEAGEIAYGDAPVVVFAASAYETSAMTVEEATGRILARAHKASGSSEPGRVVELGSFAEGNPVLRVIGTLPDPPALGRSQSTRRPNGFTSAKRWLKASTQP